MPNQENSRVASDDKPRGIGAHASPIPWRLFRRVVQTVSFLVFFGVFLLITWPLRLPFEPTILFQLDPLTHLWLLVSRQPLASIPWAIAALVLTALLGRIFCGWACPLGTMLDFSRWFVEWFQRVFHLLPAANKEKQSQNAPKPRKDSGALKLPGGINLWLFGVFLTLAALKMPLLWLFDPIVLPFKFLTVALWPALDRVARSLFIVLDDRYYAEDWWYGANQFFNRFVLPYREPTYTDTLLIVVFVFTLFVLEWKHRRWWCKYVCPLGALLRIVYFIHPIKRRLTEGCSACTLCERECHFTGDDIHDCLYCMECISSCPTHTLTFLPSSKLAEFESNVEQTAQRTSKRQSKERSERGKMRLKLAGINVSKPTFDRRVFLGSVASGLLAYPFLEVFNQKVILPVDFIRPPGVDDEKVFLDKCIKCGQCLKVCITNGLQPALFEAGLDGLWTPRIMNRMGYCEYECNLCGPACPTGAIPLLSLDEKKKAVIGTAYIDITRCIPYVSRRECSVCEEHCPIPEKAIVMVDVEAFTPDGERYISKRPVVKQELCTGCGICEYKCPLPGDSAIPVYRPVPETGLGTFEADPAGGDYGY